MFLNHIALPLVLIQRYGYFGYFDRYLFLENISQAETSAPSSPFS